MGRTILIALVVAIVVGGAAGFGGYKLGDGAGFERANQVRQQFAQTRQNTGQGAQSQQGGFGGQAGARGMELQGVVKGVDGNKVTVTIGQRDVTVTLTDKTQVLKSVTGARADLTVGARVSVAPETTGGGAGSGGLTSVNATSITLLPAQ